MTHIIIAIIIPIALALVGVVWSARIRRRPGCIDCGAACVHGRWGNHPEPECGHVGCAVGVCVEAEIAASERARAAINEARERQCTAESERFAECRAQVAQFLADWEAETERRRREDEERAARADALRRERGRRKSERRAARKAAPPKAKLTARERRGRGAHNSRGERT